MSMVTYIYPEYVGQFRCDGKVCGSRCCRDWSVAVDPGTYEKYQELEPEEVRDEICGWFSGQDEKGNYPVRLREDRRCPFLRQDSLCRLQRDYGEEFLSDICYSYPRVTYRIGEVVEQSLAMSCPVAARLLLGQEGPLRFVEEEREEQRRGWQFDMTDKVGQHGEDWQDLQSAGIWLLQDRRLTLDQCLFSLLSFYRRAEVLLEAGDGKGFGRLLEDVESGEFSLRAMEEGRGGEFSRTGYIRTMMDLFHALYGAPSNEERLGALLGIYEWQHPIFIKQLLQEHRSLFENYLANEFFLRFYPYAYPESMEGNARIFVLSWKVMEFALLMMSAQGDMGFEKILLGIDRLTERLDHNRDAMRIIREYLKENPIQHALVCLQAFCVIE